MAEPTETSGATSAGPPRHENPAADGLLRTVIPGSTRKPRSADPDDDPAVPRPQSSRVDYPIPDRPEPPPVPNGWYSITGTDDLALGEVLSVVAVARELVVYRDRNGEAHVIDAHCPHLGAHLGGGTVSGDTITCPYHGWRYGPDGACVEIPYSDARIPSRACVNTYPVCEQDGFVFFWYHAGGRPPAYEIPRVEELAEPGWSRAHPWRFELVAAMQEMAENNVDYAHLKYVHRRAYVPNDTSRFIPDGPFSTVIELLPDGQEFYRHTWGPGVAILRVPNLMTVFTTTTPIDRRHCRMHWHFLFKGQIEEMSEDLIAGVTGPYGLQADVPIWRDKIFLEQPVLVKADGNIAEFRQWYSQFYES